MKKEKQVSVYLTPKELNAQMEQLGALRSIVKRDHPEEKLLKIRIDGELNWNDLEKIREKTIKLVITHYNEFMEEVWRPYRGSKTCGELAIEWFSEIKLK